MRAASRRSSRLSSSAIARLPSASACAFWPRLASRTVACCMADDEAGFQVVQVGKFRNKDAVDKHQPARIQIAQQSAGVPGTGFGRGIRRVGQRLGIAHQRAQVGIFPFLDAPMRQALFGEYVKGCAAPRRDRFVAGQPVAHLRKGLRQRGLRCCLDHGDFGVHAGTSS